MQQYIEPSAITKLCMKCSRYFFVEPKARGVKLQLFHNVKMMRIVSCLLEINISLCLRKTLIQFKIQSLCNEPF